MLRHHPILVTVFGHAQAQEKYGISCMTRDTENVEAMQILEPADWRTWNHSDIDPNEDAIIHEMLRTNKVLRPKVVWAPMFELEGHEQHNMVARAAEVVFPGRVRSYATYSRGSARTRTPNEVRPEPDWPALKLKAMACYTSQINLDNTRDWFSDWSREWVA